MSMDLTLNQDRQLIRDAAEDFLVAHSTSAQVRAAQEGDSGYDEAVWRQLSGELGWCGIAVAERFGGMGLGLFELALLQEQAGRHLLAAPLFTTAGLAAPLLAEAGSEAACERWLMDIAAGELSATVALSARGFDPFAAGDGVQATRVDDGYRLSGRCRHVAGAHAAELVLVVATLDGAPAVLTLAAGTPGMDVTPLVTLDQGRRVADIAFDVTLPADARIDHGGAVAQSIQNAAARAAIVLAAEQVGGAQQCLDLTVAYLAERQQFGRPLASFQALKHRCAEMMVQIESARSAVYGAAAEVDAGASDRDLFTAAASARCFACAAYRFCAQEAIQLHGGVGFTWEYDPHLHFKRTQAFSHWLGSPDAWRERVAAQLLEQAA
jgi:alkylation response protein AidB-like acyl-CoA dehydrogenase